MDPVEGTAAEEIDAIGNSAEAPHIKRKENNQLPQQPESGKTVEHPLDTAWPRNLPLSRSPETFLEALAGESPSREPHSEPESSRSSVDPGAMVEELTLKNYKNHLWQNLTRLSDGSRDALSIESLTMGNRPNMRRFFMQQFGMQRPPLPSTKLNPNHPTVSEDLRETGNRAVSSTRPAVLSSGVRTKMLPSSGFPQFMVKSNLKGKGVAYQSQQAHNLPAIVIRGQDNERSTETAAIVSDPSYNPSAKAGHKALFGGGNCSAPPAQQDGLSLREWLKQRHRKFDKAERMHIFKQILELIDISHSQGLALQHLRPPYFLILPTNQVRYKGSLCPPDQKETLTDTEGAHYMEHHPRRKRYLEQDKDVHPSPKNQKMGEHSQFGIERNEYRVRGELKGGGIPEEIYASNIKPGNSMSDYKEQLKLAELYHPWTTSRSKKMHDSSFRLSQIELMKLEERWYASPEELNERTCSFSSNIYNLGVLLFELFCYFETWQVHSSAMSDLRHRILPQNFLLESPNEASFCLWLLHPEASSRPKSRDILKCDLICGGRDLSSLDQSSTSIDEEDTEADLLLQFLLSLKEEKDKKAAKLLTELGCLQEDTDEVQRRHLLRSELISNSRNMLLNSNDISDMGSPLGQIHAETRSIFSMSNTNEERLMRNIDKLESAYFSMRVKIEPSETNVAVRSDKDVLNIRDRFSDDPNDRDMLKEPNDQLGAFFEGLCKFGRYSRFKVRGSLRNVDILNSANVICSLSFDRDEEYFAAAGVSKKIKIFEFGALLNDGVDIHYPMIEMSSRSRLSCVCWNGYVKNYLASTDYDGVVQLWDASTGQGFTQYREHQKRAWSVDFSQTDPLKLASGSDDCFVKLWSINEKNCIDTIRSTANVCCVQFSHSSHLLAFGSADYKVYCYDLRNTRIPWCTLTGHRKAVSYVKFVDSETLVSASTDNTLKLWDLNKTSQSGLSTNACSLTFTGHTNEKNFVGLSVSDGYIACGSETNEVYSYYKTLPMSMTSHKFGSMDPITGRETGDDNGQFVSSVCWKGKSDMLVAANSTGSMKLLQLV